MGAPEILCYQPFSRANQNEWGRWKPEAVGKGLGQFEMVWGNLGRMDILSPAPPEDGDRMAMLRPVIPLGSRTEP